MVVIDGPVRKAGHAGATAIGLGHNIVRGASTLVCSVWGSERARLVQQHLPPGTPGNGRPSAIVRKFGLV